MKKVQKALNNLNGMAANDIATYFKLKGYKGTRGSATTCPLANYLRKHTGNKVFSVNFLAVHTRSNTLFLNDNVSKFVMKFDQGSFPELVE